MLQLDNGSDYQLELAHFDRHKLHDIIEETPLNTQARILLRSCRPLLLLSFCAWAAHRAFDLQGSSMRYMSDGRAFWLAHIDVSWSLECHL